ncbi:MAG TPA: hypothetical protein VFK58_08695 [Sphingomicrobium sp.]|nr:hypothetical protein [Sphingomicrobium sp.]
MIYGLDHRLFVENGPAVRAAEARLHSSSNAYRAWGSLGPERRFEAVEMALRPANDCDCLPVAL